MRICSHLLNRFLTKKFIFSALICVSKQTEITVKKKITYFKKSSVASSLTLFEKVFAIFKIFTVWCLDVRFRDLLYFICLKFSLQYRYFLSAGRKCADLEVTFKRGREETLRYFCKTAKAVFA